MDKKKILEDIKTYITENDLNDKEILKFISDLKLDIVCDYYKDKEGIYVIKKKGTVEKFDRDKLFNSLANTSDAAGTMMTKSDIEIVIREVNRKIEANNRNVVTTVELRDYVTNSLIDNSYTKVEQMYNS
ncbi:ATP cone domain-containing protein [Miniphocaeibacter halophilus]|uniref:Uncharacterized protein n=1 Tax=Miniphocaeibacter halophilus TaxID=2931922 RepID=A0AC61MTB8_9FIRM|nr:ATP cone domain-containing protein [Miniphocaeibacter halophilus]QQK08069.1 hypothetical protein JFY71_00605 [Miniphocaeibacter halophilus]